MTVPDWVQDAVFYQIFPDRFANGDTTNDPPNVQPWNAPPTLWKFQGGDLQGVIQKFDYLLDLGITAIYLNPIFQATSVHRYNTTDYYKIDPKLGTFEDFHALIDLAHQNGVRVILDGVFNHCGRGFFAFNDVLENTEYSPFLDWFHIKQLPLDAYGPGKAKNYLAWWNYKSLPKFNTDHAEVRQYLFNVARYWIEQGADGWRLDVPNEIDDDTFWNEFREVVKAANPEAYLVGEIWEADPRWVGPGHFDGLIHYPLREVLLDFLVDNTLKASTFVDRVVELFELYPRENSYAHFIPLGSHDTLRLLTVCGGDEWKARQAFLFQFCHPGAPIIYYGDEIGVEGQKDPLNRHTFPWKESSWNHALRAYVQKLIALRHRLPQLRRGHLKPLAVDDEMRVCAFSRILEEGSAAVLLNASGSSQRIQLDVSDLGWADGQRIQEGLAGEEAVVSKGQLEVKLKPHGGALLFG
jgi:cyclomaltodextrinase